MKKIILLVFLITFAGCTNSSSKNEAIEMADINMNAPNISTSSVYLKNPYENAPFEFGFYLGSGTLYSDFIEFENDNVSHFSYCFEMEIKKDVFPATDVLKCYINNKTPTITLYFNENNFPDTLELIETAKAFGSLNIPMYVNLMPFSSTSWHDIDSYKKNWEEVADAFAIISPNSTIIWSISKSDTPLCENVMPNSSKFTYVGLMFYGDTENGYTTFFNALDHLYQATEKPILITALGISHYSTSDHTYKQKEMLKTLDSIYTNVITSYPRVFGIFYINKDLALSSPANTISNNYRITSDKNLIDGYNKIVSASKLIPRDYYKSPFSGIILDNEGYISTKFIEYHFGSKPDMAKESFFYPGYVSLNSLDYNFSIENNCIYIRKK